MKAHVLQSGLGSSCREASFDVVGDAKHQSVSIARCAGFQSFQLQRETRGNRDCLSFIVFVWNA